MDLALLTEKSLTITVVEDDPIILNDIVRMIDASGHTVLNAFQSGDDLLKSDLTKKFDILMVDIELEGSINGIEAAAKVLKILSVPIIYLTSYSDNVTFRQILQTNPYGYILKPAKEEQLKVAIEIAYYKFSMDKKIAENEKRYHSIVETLPLMLARFKPETGQITYCNRGFQEFFHCSEMGENFFNTTVLSIFPAIESIFHTLNEKNLFSMSEEKVTVDENAEWFRIIYQALIDDTGTIFEYQFIAENITARKVNEAELLTKSNELNRRIRELSCLYTISSILENCRSLELIMQSIVDEILHTLHDREHISVCIEYGYHTFYSEGYFSSTPNYNNPIIVHNSVVGNIRLNISEQRRLTSFVSDDEAKLISAVGELISKTVVKNESESQLKKLEREIIMISEREKQNLGHELHDGIGQILTGTSFILKSLEKKLGKSSEIPKEFEEINQLIRDATTRCRRLSKGLVPVSYSNETFVYLVEQLLHSSYNLYSLDFSIDIPEDFNIKSSFVSSQLFRIVQEAVNNIIKHSGADFVTIGVGAYGSVITLSITDNGKGIEHGKESNGLGMNIMKYRADLIGADFDVYSLEKGGTMIAVQFPKTMATFKGKALT
jgi:signal transduction histidine kinase/DNA-binding NarL/FixJ family response regulator